MIILILGTLTKGIPDFVKYPFEETVAHLGIGAQADLCWPVFVAVPLRQLYDSHVSSGLDSLHRGEL